MVVTFWGVRGSTPAPGPGTVRYGGHTACVSVRLDDRLVILDAGTGIRALGDHLVASEDERIPITIVLTHLHTDHISGFPFFAPLYNPDQCIELVDYPTETGHWSLLSLLDGVHFPLETSDVPSIRRCAEDDAPGVLAKYGLQVERLSVTHPGGAFGYRLTHDERAFVYVPDHEIDAPSVTTSRDEVVAFCEGADVLCHDAQYLDSEHDAHRGWGHSTIANTCDLAADAGVKHLVLFHHDPQRTDDALDRIQAKARARLDPQGVECTVAYEGLKFDLSRSQPPTPTSDPPD